MSNKHICIYEPNINTLNFVLFFFIKVKPFLFGG